MEIDVYCDESHPDLFASRDSVFSYLVIGGIWAARDNRSRFKAELHELRDKHHYGGEFKWQKASGSKVEFYLDLVEWFFAQGDELRYRCVVVDKRRVDLARYHDGDQELGFYKFYYQLLKHWIRPGNAYQVFVDFKTNRRRDRLWDLRQCIEHACVESTIPLVQAVRSEESVLIQMADFLTGAVSASLNESVEGSASKWRLITEIEAKIGGGIRATGQWEKKFNVFVIQPHGGW